ncbi:MAG: hypothetical protein QOG67_2762 [Verrucomicrobiota bacterium]
MEGAGFDGGSMIFELRTVEWSVPTARYPFDAELNAGVRTAGLLSRQTAEVLEKIRAAIEKDVHRYAKDGSFVIPKSAYRGGGYERKGVQRRPRRRRGTI